MFELLFFTGQVDAISADVHFCQYSVTSVLNQDAQWNSDRKCSFGFEDFHYLALEILVCFKRALEVLMHFIRVDEFVFPADVHDFAWSAGQLKREDAFVKILTGGRFMGVDTFDCQSDCFLLDEVEVVEEFEFAGDFLLGVDAWLVNFSNLHKVVITVIVLATIQGIRL